MRKQQGFTLIEVMVAMAIMAVIGAMSWAGLDVLVRSQQSIETQGVRNAQMQIALQQWALDLDQAWMPEATQPMGWDGKVFRLTRAVAQPERGIVVVAWAVRDGGNGAQLMRWQSPVFVQLEQWQAAWEQAANWGRSSGADQGVALMPVQSMDVFIWSNGAWVNGQSSQISERRGSGLSRLAKNNGKAQPNGVRVMLTLVEGTLTKDWVSLSLSEAKS